MLDFKGSFFDYVDIPAERDGIRRYLRSKLDMGRIRELRARERGEQA